MHHFDQTIFRSIESLDWPLTAIIRLLLAAACGGLVGLEREIRGRQAGFRTNLLVCLGSAIVMVVSTRFAFFDWGRHEGYAITIDPARIAYGVMAGIGLLAAGAILKADGDIRGLTTAAGLWCVTALGLAAGFGLYLFVVIATLLVVAALWILNYAEHLLPRTRHRTITLRRPWEEGCVIGTVHRLRETGFAVMEWTFDRAADEKVVDIHLHIAFPGRADYDALEERLSESDAGELISIRKM